FAHPPWTLRYLQGHVDAPFLNLTPGTRTGFVHDAAYATLCDGLQPLARKLTEVIAEQRRAEKEQASREQLRAIQRAFREALLALPAEEYDWFDIHARAFRPTARSDAAEAADQAGAPADERPARTPGAPATAFGGEIVEGPGALESAHDQAVRYHAPPEPGLARIRATVRQNDVVCSGEALVTVTHELLAQLGHATTATQGLPGYTFERAPGESWRSRLDPGRNVIVVNNGHRDFVFASRSKSLKLRYLVRLYAKELIIRNFVGLPAEQLLERMVELSLRTEENL